jgi:hypothetical protein
MWLTEKLEGSKNWRCSFPHPWSLFYSFFPLPFYFSFLRRCLFKIFTFLMMNLSVLGELLTGWHLVKVRPVWDTPSLFCGSLFTEVCLYDLHCIPSYNWGSEAESTPVARAQVNEVPRGLKTTSNMKYKIKFQVDLLLFSLFHADR